MHQNQMQAFDRHSAPAQRKESPVTPIPKVSVVLPAYNVAAYIADAIQSVLAQTIRDFEIIVVNDGSPDTEAMELALAPFRDQIEYIKQENTGVSGARNAGIRASRAEFVALLDPDDMWEPDYLELQLECLTEAPTAAGVYPNATFFGGSHLDGMLYTDIYPSSGPVSVESFCSGRCNIFGQGMFRRAPLDAIGLYDTTLKTSEDLDVYLRLLADGYQIVYHSQPIYRYRRRPGQVTTNERLLSFSLVEVLSRLAKSPALSSQQRAAVARRIGHVQSRIDLIDGKTALARGDLLVAREKLTRANLRLRSLKISVALLASRIAPNWTMKMVRSRVETQ